LIILDKLCIYSWVAKKGKKAPNWQSEKIQKKRPKAFNFLIEISKK
jgi:hypothetical protein